MRMNLIAIVAQDAMPVSADAAAQIADAGPEFFDAGQRSCSPTHAGDFKAWTRAIAEATGRKGAAAVHAVASGADRRQRTAPNSRRWSD